MVAVMTISPDASCIRSVVASDVFSIAGQFYFTRNLAFWRIKRACQGGNSVKVCWGDVPIVSVRSRTAIDTLRSMLYSAPQRNDGSEE
jgi:hypothetical protein